MVDFRIKRRLYVCSNCPILSIIDGLPACGICGCVLAAGNKSAVNLARRPETDQYGCKWNENLTAGSYILKDSGSRWKKAGV